MKEITKIRLDFALGPHSLDVHGSVSNALGQRKGTGTARDTQLSYSWPERPKKPELRHGELNNPGEDREHRHLDDISINYVYN